VKHYFPAKKNEGIIFDKFPDIGMMFLKQCHHIPFMCVFLHCNTSLNSLCWLIKPRQALASKCTAKRKCNLRLLGSSWRTLAYQEVRLQIGPLAKQGCFKSTADNFLVYIVTISLASGPIRSLIWKCLSNEIFWCWLVYLQLTIVIMHSNIIDFDSP